ncbi:MAG: N-acetylmuramic acid 6-phosphate etherase [Candidatus Marinimicrobia bacterium]|jgi:N-acetylmuramic acid 6-phosphate etherase|nr:N-acetylmuramic acid 6-phosphate etherase [Candidatus Neomarinimicrobiota bacterium]MDP6611737.1 N-acetylmuramic acid 6-phosphate etherase [Candidatus Neomarinimicrobiota bacterium]|tara:strand:- start:63647 stop:64546 length:900 start_codon:yes stop_codon:yes gene_type:complete
METTERKNLSTEQQNVNSSAIDDKSISEILNIINAEDQAIAEKVNAALLEIEKAVELTTAAIQNGNRVVYVGSGTSGRLGVLDASEMPPTYSVPADWFNGIIAGGDEALRRSIEGAEDQPESAVTDLQTFGLKSGDVVIGISTSGAAQYVKSSIEFGKSIGAKTVYLICNEKPYLSANADVVIKVDTGPEVITGSTRMKAGTATKMVLNMISTATMVRLGKVYGNLMVDLMAVNDKLVDRGTRIIEKLTGVDYDTANAKLFEAGKSLKTAVVMINKNCSKVEAQRLLQARGGFLRKVIE